MGTAEGGHDYLATQGTSMTGQEAKARSTSRLPRLLRGSWVPICLILGSAAWLSHDAAQPPQPLRAAASPALDTDGDGLVDVIEHQLGTHSRLADTDGDGLSDAMEIARGSSPRHADSLPKKQRPMDVGIVVHGIDEMLHLQFLVYSEDGNLRDKHMLVTAMAGRGRLVEVPVSALVRLGGLSVVERDARGGSLFLLDLPIHPRTVYGASSVSVSASVAAPATKLPGAADVLDLVNVEGTICARVDGTRLMASSTGGGGQNVNINAGGAAQNTGSIFLPVFRPTGSDINNDTETPGGENPSTATPGQICVQRTMAVGVVGGAIVREVVSSDCEEGWDGYCSASCSGSVGDRFRSIDPVAFAGG